MLFVREEGPGKYGRGWGLCQTKVNMGLNFFDFFFIGVIDDELMLNVLRCQLTY